MSAVNKQLLDAYSCVGKGWWPLLEKYIPAMQAIDPDCTFDVKEKYAELRLQATPSVDCEDYDTFWRLEQEAEDASAHICEYCGQPGRLCRENRSWYLTLCDDCNTLDKEGLHDLYLEKQLLLGKKYEAAIGPERAKELREQWCTLPDNNTLQSDEYKVWYRSLTHEEQGAVLGWNAEVEDYVRNEM